MLYCKNCEHAKSGAHPMTPCFVVGGHPTLYFLCYHPTQVKTNLVYGYKYSNTLCEECREDETKCGNKGEWFKEKLLELHKKPWWRFWSTR